MPLPYPNTITRPRVVANARALIDEGVPHAIAYAQAFSRARQTYFKRYPQGMLPKWLRFAPTLHRAADYNADGQSYKGNPARSVQVRKAARLFSDFTGDEAIESVKVNIPGVRFKVGFIVGHVLALGLDLPDATRATLRFAPNDGGGLPALAVSSDGREVAFVGGDYSTLRDHLSLLLDKPEITAIMYRTVRDGKTENYRHPFAPHARPALQVIDERNAKMSGGSFRFTDRGFVDSR